MTNVARWDKDTFFFRKRIEYRFFRVHVYLYRWVDLMLFNLQIQSCNINNPSKMIASLILWVKNYKQHNDIYKWIMTDNDLTGEIIDHWDQGWALHKLQVTTTFTLFYQNIYEHNIIHSGLTNRIFFLIFWPMKEKILFLQ